MYYFFLNEVIVSWSNKKQRTVSTSTTKVEYIVFRQVARKVVWIRKFINKMKLEIVENFTLYVNNEINIALIKNAKSQHQIKYMDVHHHYISKLVNKKKLTIKWISESRILTNKMTKVLPTEIFRKHQALLRLTIR